MEEFNEGERAIHADPSSMARSISPSAFPRNRWTDGPYQASARAASSALYHSQGRESPCASPRRALRFV